MKKNKKVIILSIILVLILVVVAIGISYAYFATQEINEGSVEVITSTSKGSKVVYTPGDDIVFEKAEPGTSKTSLFNISLTAPEDSSDTIKFGFNWDITDNTFLYESEFPDDAQLIYSLYYSSDNSNWTPYKEYVDCTTSKGNIELLNDYSLTAAAGKTNIIYWKFVLEYKAYDYNQTTNMSKILEGSILLDKEAI